MSALVRMLKLPEAVRTNGITVLKANTDILAAVALRSSDPRYDATYLANYLKLNVIDVIADDVLDYVATEGEVGKPIGHDVLEGYVSIESAARDYGVLIDPLTLEITCLQRSNLSQR